MALETSYRLQTGSREKIVSEKWEDFNMMGFNFLDAN